ncbi:MAG: hypothetical protein K0R38_4788 [Polyangiaceae bacterium]|jgi:hypothetical protein|nr:hypothetical protein [Polyangiaceae bacterium]
MKYVNEAHRLIHLSGTGPRPLARAAGVAVSTAAAWAAGKKKPGTDEAKIAVELKLRVPRESWAMAPGFFKSEGQLQLWLTSHPHCRAIDHDSSPCPICDAFEANPEPASHGQRSLAEICAIANGAVLVRQ